MKVAVLKVLQALYKREEITAQKADLFSTTRVTNEICYIRNTLKIKVLLERVKTNKSWYGKYELERSMKNLDRVIQILKLNEDESRNS